ncbi:hypothetical protein [Nocardia wallacei]|uniref:hypothetical protein n=1 Tax=Nocardia wallacei TaxID=480035 RepID=UPI0024554453|nr:hypothetical protein [Nocardia wallacei]
MTTALVIMTALAAGQVSQAVRATGPVTCSPADIHGVIHCDDNTQHIQNQRRPSTATSSSVTTAEIQAAVGRVEATPGSPDATIRKVPCPQPGAADGHSTSAESCACGN